MSKQRKAHNGADLVGKTFTRLTVVERAENNRHGNRRWVCVCDCGKKVVATSAKLIAGATKSCGCYARDLHTSHGMHGSQEYAIWTQMIGRCHNPSGVAKYSRYGGRGIVVCDRWRSSFQAFYEDMGPRPSSRHTVERKNNDGPYSPENCAWATWDVQYRNRRPTVWIEYDGERMCQKDWCRRYGLDEATFTARLKRGWPLARALTEPAKIQRGKNVERRLTV